MAFIRNKNKKNIVTNQPNMSKQEQNEVVQESIQNYKSLKSSKIDEFQPQFTKDEAIWMMSLIKDCTFKGEDVQRVYEAVVKLQLIVNESK